MNCASAPAGSSATAARRGPALAAPEAVGEQQQQHAGAERERGRERAERAGQYFGHGVHTAVPEAWKDAGGDVQKTYEGAGSGDEDGDGLGARSVQCTPQPC